VRSLALVAAVLSVVGSAPTEAPEVGLPGLRVTVARVEPRDACSQLKTDLRALATRVFLAWRAQFATREPAPATDKSKWTSAFALQLELCADTRPAGHPLNRCEDEVNISTLRHGDEVMDSRAYDSILASGKRPPLPSCVVRPFRARLRLEFSPEGWDEDDVALEIARALENEDPLLREMACAAAAALGPAAEGLLEVLEPLKHDRSPEVRDAARQAISAIKPR
jgi:hypothetical protein